MNIRTRRFRTLEPDCRRLEKYKTTEDVEQLSTYFAGPTKLFDIRTHDPHNVHMFAHIFQIRFSRFSLNTTKETILVLVFRCNFSEQRYS